MNTTVKLNRSPSKAIAIAAHSGTGTEEEACQDCVKAGLAILPVTKAVLPNEVKGVLPGLDAWLDTADLKEHWYFMRSLPSGYLYVLKSDEAGNAPAIGGWDTYVVDTDGLLRKMPPAGLPIDPGEIKPMKETCRRKGDNIPAQVIAINEKRHPKAWLAFSRYRWSLEVLSRYAKNTDKCRDLRMQMIDVVAAAAGELGRETAVPAGMKMGPHVVQAVADYGPESLQRTVNAQVIEAIRNRHDQVDSLVSAMARISSETPAKSGAVIVLDDAVGVVYQLNMVRNRKAADAAATAGLGDANRARRRVVAEIIEGIRVNATNNPGPWWNRNYGPDRYLKHINKSEWEASLRESQSFTRLLKAVDAISADYVAVKEGVQWIAQQRFDFDPTDGYSWRDHGRMVECGIVGSGLTKIERERVWLPVIQGTVAVEENWLDRALVALHPDAVKYLQTDKKQDKAYDLVKAAASISLELTSKGLKELSRLYAQLRNARAANAALSSVVQSSAALLYRLRVGNPEAHYKLMRKVAVALLVRDGQLAQPKIVRGPLDVIAKMIQEVAVGPARVAGLPVKLRPEVVDVDAYKALKGNFGDEGWRLSQALDGAVMFDAPKTKAKNGEVVAWVITRLREGASLDSSTVAKLGLENIDLTGPKPGVTNPFLAGYLTRLGAKADTALSAGVIFFQINSFMSALEDFRTKVGPLDRAGGGLGMLTAVLSASSAGLQATVAVQVLRGVDQTQLVGTQVWAARLALYAGLIEGVYLVIKGTTKARSDTDSGLWTIGTGVAIAGASLAGYGSGLALASGLASGGALTGTGTVLGVTLGPVAWALIALAFLGAAIYFSIQAFGTDDENITPVEYWLDNGVFGLRQQVSGDAAKKNPFFKQGAVQPFASIEEELVELQRVTMVVNASIGGARDRGGYSLVTSYQIAVPKYEAGTRLEVKFFAIKGKTRVDAGGIVCEDGQAEVARNTISQNFTGLRQGPTMKVDAETGLMYLEGVFATMREEMALERFVEWVAGKNFNPDALYADHIEMLVKYEPNRISMPGLVSTAEGRN